MSRDPILRAVVYVALACATIGAALQCGVGCEAATFACQYDPGVEATVCWCTHEPRGCGGAGEPGCLECPLP